MAGDCGDAYLIKPIFPQSAKSENDILYKNNHLDANTNIFGENKLLTFRKTIFNKFLLNKPSRHNILEKYCYDDTK